MRTPMAYKNSSLQAHKAGFPEFLFAQVYPQLSVFLFTHADYIDEHYRRKRVDHLKANASRHASTPAVLGGKMA